jgi:3-oxoacyl-[acyl-carrier protein] reductase
MTVSDFSLKGRTALVTGGSRGIGAAVVETLAFHGADVAFCHLADVIAASALIARLSCGGMTVDGIEADVADESAVDMLASWTSERLGHVDILVNCAGIGGGAPFVELTVAAWDRMINVHLRGTFLVTRVFFPGMIERRYGRIINIASQLGYKGAPALAHYCAAKAGIIGFTRALSYEGAPYGVLVNSVAPGPVQTDLLNEMSEEWRMTKRSQLPLGRFAHVEEIAPTVLFLASDAASYYVGQTLSPNGGDVMI